MELHVIRDLEKLFLVIRDCWILRYTWLQYLMSRHTWSDALFSVILLKGLRLAMWSLLHDTDQPREMLSTDQSLRDRRSRGLWSVLSISRGWSVSCNSWPNHQSQTDYNMLPQSRPELLCYIAGNIHYALTQVSSEQSKY